MKIKSLICSCFAVLLLVSCASPDEYKANITDDSSNTEAAAPEASDVVASEYSYTESLESQNNIEKVGIVSNGVIVEGAEYTETGYKCLRYDDESKEYVYTTIGESYEPFELSDKIPEGIPVIKYSTDFEVVVKIENKGYSTDIRYGNKIYTQSELTTPGIYYLTVHVNFANPMFDKEIEPKIGENYIMSNKYIFALVVE